MPMKNSNVFTRVVMSLLLLGVLVYFGFYVYRSYTGGLTTVLAYEETVNVGARASGLVVRQEQALTYPGVGAASVDLSPSEGEKVSGGGVVATLYGSSAGLETKQAIRTLEAELEQLEYAKASAAAGASDASKTEGELLGVIAQLHAGACAGDLTGLDRDVLRLRTLVFRRDYTYGGDTQQLDAVIDRKSAQLNELRASLGTASTVIRAPQAGVFSSMTDGYETLLSPDILDGLTVSQLIQLEEQDPVPPADAVGKLVTSSTWYFAASAPTREVRTLREGAEYTVSFTRDFSGRIPMLLERIGRDEGGNTLLIFSCRSNLSDAAALRRQTANVVTQSITGVRVPRSALRALRQTVKRTVTDEATGEKTTVEEEVTVTGVYTVPARQAQFTPVTVLYQGEDYFLVAPANPDAAGRLRAGDEILVYTAGITDGKVVR